MNPRTPRFHGFLDQGTPRAKRMPCFRVFASLQLLILASGCAAPEPATDIEFTRTDPTGTVIEAKLTRIWQGGPVAVRAEYDPANGKWVIEWKSDVSLEAAVHAAAIQADAQRQAFEHGIEAGIRIAAGAAGIPLPGR